MWLVARGPPWRQSEALPMDAAAFDPFFGGMVWTGHKTTMWRDGEGGGGGGASEPSETQKDIQAISDPSECRASLFFYSKHTLQREHTQNRNQGHGCRYIRVQKGSGRN